jgi:beta-glucanase (GH16 family)
MLQNVLSTAALVLTSVLVTVTAASFCDAPGWTPEWREDFAGSSLDPTKWSVYDGPSVGACRDALCTPDNVAVYGGALHLTTQRKHESFDGKTYNFTTGAVNTYGKAHWSPTPRYRLCVSARLPGHSSPPGAAQGLWPAVWMMPDDDSCDPDEGEMDLLEMIDGNGLGYATYHWETTWPKANCSYPQGHESISSNLPLAAWNSTFHEFAVERGHDFLAFVYDGVTVVNSSGANPAPLLWDMPFALIINTAIGGSWPGEPTDATILPVEHTVDYVYVSTLTAEAGAVVEAEAAGT